MRIDIAAQTDIGRRKRNNEDSLGVFRDDTPGLQLFDEGALLCVADGLGGHTGGEIASKLAVSNMRDLLKVTPPPQNGDPDEEPMLGVIHDSFERANMSIFQTNQDLVKSGRPMGTTLLSVLVTPRKAFIGNVGDSRCYHIREGEIIGRTEDHSWVDEQVKLGLMSKSEAESDARKNVVTRCIGTHPDVEIDTYTWHVVPGDTLLLCTDGLVNMVKDTDIIAEFRKNLSPAEIAHRLVMLANDGGGKDNITVIVADLNPSIGTMMGRRIRTFSKKRGAKLIWLTVALLTHALCFAGGWLVHQHFGNTL